MNRALRTGLLLVGMLVSLYLFFFLVIVRNLERLNAARDEELKAATTHQDLLRRVPRGDFYAELEAVDQ